MAKKSSSPTATAFGKDDRVLPYRLNVGLAIFNPRGLVFLGERRQDPGAWQMPQGGIKQGQTAEEAVWAELREETGLTAHTTIIAAMPQPIDYDFPDYVQGKIASKYRGQRQHWFALLYRGPDSAVQLENAYEPEHPEFRSWRWATLEEAVRLIVDFKRPAYEQVAAWAAPLVAAIRQT